jgi:hypothetical protein
MSTLERIRKRIRLIWLLVAACFASFLSILIIGPMFAIPMTLFFMLAQGAVFLTTRCPNYNCNGLVVGYAGGLYGPPLWTPTECPFCGYDFDDKPLPPPEADPSAETSADSTR